MKTPFSAPLILANPVQAAIHICAPAYQFDRMTTCHTTSCIVVYSFLIAEEVCIYCQAYLHRSISVELLLNFTDGCGNFHSTRPAVVLFVFFGCVDTLELATLVRVLVRHARLKCDTLCL